MAAGEVLLCLKPVLRFKPVLQFKRWRHRMNLIVNCAFRVCYYDSVEQDEQIGVNLDSVRTALADFPEVAFAVLFGSAVSGRLRTDSDIDIAVYGDSDRALEIETERVLLDEPGIQIAIERAIDRNVDLLVLNRAPATVAATALLNGRTLFIRDGAIYSRYFLAVTTVAMDFLELEREFRRIRARSASLSEIDRSRLHRILEFIREELEDQPQFEQLSLRQYETDRAMRRNLDRWVEMLINAAIDAAKIVLAAERRRVPQTYGQILELIDTVPGFTDIGERLKPLAALRNILAHEYLDLRFVRLQSFVHQDIQAVRDLAEAVYRWMQQEHSG